MMLSLNAAYAASVGVCDALEHTSSHAVHFGHHSHGHGDGHDHDDRQAGDDDVGKMTSVGDHHHSHVHPGFSCLLSDEIGVVPLTVGNATATDTPDTFISASPALLERPPRATLA